MAVTTGPDEVEAQLIVPAEVVKAIGELVGKTPRNAPPPSPEEATEQLDTLHDSARVPRL